MNNDSEAYEGMWLHEGDRHGQSFRHHSSQYDHSGDGSTPVQLRHAVVKQEGREVGVWVPRAWTDDQIAEALNSNW